MRILLSMLVAAFVLVSGPTVFAGKACCGASKQKAAEKADCADCGYVKGSQECAEACADDDSSDEKS